MSCTRSRSRSRSLPCCGLFTAFLHHGEAGDFSHVLGHMDYYNQSFEIRIMYKSIKITGFF